MSLTSWLNSLTSGLKPTPRPRKHARRGGPVQALEERALLSGDTLATATIVNLQDDQADDVTSEIGDEGTGNLDVDLYRVSLNQGSTLVVEGTEVSPRDQIQSVADELSALASQSDSAHIAEARDMAVAAVDALDHGSTPRVGVAFNRLRNSVDAIHDAVQDHHLGLDAGLKLANSLTGAARNMAQNVHDYADSVGGTASKLDDSQHKLDEGDDKRAISHFKQAIARYKAAGLQAHHAAADVGHADPSQALNSLIVTIRLFDAAGNEIGEVHGQGGVTLTWSITATGTYYVGISGNDNFDYDPSEEESGTEGSTGCYEMEMEENAPPVIVDVVAVPVDELNNIWKISGSITDENPEGCIINFGGILAGHTVIVEADGTFEITIQLPPKGEPGSEGLATATAMDEYAAESDEFEFVIEPDC